MYFLTLNHMSFRVHVDVIFFIKMLSTLAVLLAAGKKRQADACGMGGMCEETWNLLSVHNIIPPIITSYIAGTTNAGFITRRGVSSGFVSPSLTAKAVNRAQDLVSRKQNIVDLSNISISIL